MSALAVVHSVSLNILGFLKERGPFLGVPRETLRSQETEAFYNILSMKPLKRAGEWRGGIMGDIYRSKARVSTIEHRRSEILCEHDPKPDTEGVSKRIKSIK